MKLFKRSNGVYYVRIRRGVERSLRTRDRAKAERVFRKVEREWLEGRLVQLAPSDRIDLNSFRDEYLSIRSDQVRRSTWKADKLALDKLIDCLGNKTLRTITTKRLDSFKSFELGRISPTSVNVHLRHLKSAFSTAVEWGYLKVNPFDRVRLAREPHRKPKYYTRTEVDAILAACPDPDFRDFLTVMVYHGFRRSELCFLPVGAVSLDNMTITVIGKGDKEEVVPIVPIALPSLERHVEGRRPEERLFPKWLPDSAYTAFRRVAGPLGIKGGLHRLRHTTATFLRAAGVGLETIKAILRHEDLRTTEIYAQADLEEMRRALAKLDFAGKEQAKAAKGLKLLNGCADS